MSLVALSEAGSLLVIGDDDRNHAGSTLEINRSNSQSTYTAISWSASSALHAGGLFFIRSRSANTGTFLETQAGDQLGEMEYFGCDSGNTLSEIAAAVRCYQVGAAGAARVETKFVWELGTATNDAAERMALKTTGLELTGGLKVSGLAGTGTRAVYVDANGVLSAA